MDCIQFRKYLDNYENLDDVQLKALFDHADECEECHNELNFFNSIMKTAASIPVPEMPADFIEQVNKRIDAQTSRTGFVYKLNVASRKYAAVAACLAIGIVVGLNKTDIMDKLNGNKTDDVIQSSVVTSESTETPISEPEIETEIPRVEKNAEPVATSAPTVTFNPVVKPAVVPTEKPTGKAITKPAVKPTVKSAEKTEVSSSVPSVATTVEIPTPVVVVQESEVPSESRVTVTEKAINSGIEKNYTLEREEYYIPEETTVAEEATDKPDVENYSLATSAPETKYSYREQPMATQNAANALADYLLVSSEDIDEVACVLTELGIARAHGLYMTQTNTFYELLARLEDRNIEYDCSIKYTTGDKISFKVLLK